MRTSCIFLLLFLLLSLALANEEEDMTICPADVDHSACATTSLDETYSKNSWNSWFSWKTIVAGSLNLPLAYIKDLVLEIFGKNQTWPHLICGQGQNFCKHSKDWPGPSVRVIGSHAGASAIARLLPQKTWHGEWWRGSELALWVLFPNLHYQTDDQGSPLINPPSIALGTLPKQHVVTRKLFSRMVDMSTWPQHKVDSVTQLVESSAKHLIDDCLRDGRLTGTNISVWFQQTIHNVIFGVNISEQYAEEFASIGAVYVPASVMSYGLPKIALNRDPFKVKLLQARAKPFLKSLRDWISTEFEDVYKDADCSPSKSCLDQAVFGTFDMLQFAGGLSVPSSLMTALALLYSTDDLNPARKSMDEGFSYAPGEEMQFYWESIRFFVPVDDVPFWDVRPLCPHLNRNQTDALNKRDGKTEACPLGAANNQTGFPEMNGYKGGHRWLICLALAMQDPDVWGADAHQFRLRSVEEYNRQSVAFLEPSSDENIANGLNDRSCPGRSLALLMARAFLVAFNKEDWDVSPNSPIGLQNAVPYVKSYSLFPRREIQKCVEKECKCQGNRSLVGRWLCSRCMKKACPK